MARRLVREHQVQTLQTTDLVHEACLRLVVTPMSWSMGGPIFYAAAARAMRQVLIDAARRRGALKRGSGAAMLSLDEDWMAAADTYGAELLELDEALQRLALRNPRCVRTVECRSFGGMSVEGTATALDVSPRTLKSGWALARVWLYDALRGEGA